MIRPLYKAREPFMEVSAGYGYLGVVIYDDQEDKVQCHVCGKFFQHLGKHVNFAHRISGPDYKRKFGLTQSTPLCSVRYSRMKRKTMVKNIHLKKCANNGPQMGSKWFRRKHHYDNGHKSMMFLNRHGLCALQIQARYAVVKKIVGRSPITGEIMKYDFGLWAGLMERFKTINKARAWLGEDQMGSNDLRMIPNIELIAHLRKFKRDNGRRPQAKDFMGGNGLPNNARYWKRFGSWNQALSAAGLR